MSASHSEKGDSFLSHPIIYVTFGRCKDTADRDEYISKKHSRFLLFDSILNRVKVMITLIRWLFVDGYVREVCIFTLLHHPGHQILL